MPTTDLPRLTPELVLIAAAAAIYLGGAFWTTRRAWHGIAGGALLAAAGALWFQQDNKATADSLNFDTLAWLGQWFALAVGALLMQFVRIPKNHPSRHGCLPTPPHDDDAASECCANACGAVAHETDNTPEQVGSLLLTIAGLMLVVVAGDLTLLFVSLELISIPTYVLLYLGRRDEARQEAAAKYFFLSVFSSAILLYGLSFLYGVAGSTDLAVVRAALEGTSPDGAVPAPAGFAAFGKLAMTLVFAGLCFKISAVPFHFYAPDVYQGTTHANAALLSVVPKAAGLAALVRILVAAMPSAPPHAWQIILAISVLTMTLGNAMALWQDNLRRLMAYSSIANAGYMLLALAVALADGGSASDWNGVEALWFYLVTYSAATIGAFAVFEHLGRPDHRLEAVDELSGLSRTRPAVAAVLAVCLFSLAGVPPLAGFWGKFWVFGGALNAGGPCGATGNPWGNAQGWFVAAAIFGAVNAAVAAAYYLRIVAVMYFRAPLATLRAEGGAGAGTVPIFVSTKMGLSPLPCAMAALTQNSVQGAGLRTEGGAGAWWAAVVCAAMVVGVGVFPDCLTPRKEKAATPACPAFRSDGSHESVCGVCPQRLYRSPIVAIIGRDSDICLSLQQEFGPHPRKNLPWR